MNPCVFMDRDGVLNKERGDFTFLTDDFIIPEFVPGALKDLKKAGFKLVVITNQSGISRGLFTRQQMEACHDKLNRATENIIDGIYYCPYHPDVTATLSRKPGTLLFERAIAKFSVDTDSSWMVGDAERDLLPARQLGIKTIFIGIGEKSEHADYYAGDLAEAARIILEQSLPLNR